ncbi:MAG: SRPBCC family protein [Xenococcaceae cyanobacterium MO_188.B29]|nr:SRPBCC family protein [Xenococcaceae cyanobacterium MO_188.B29]
MSRPIQYKKFYWVFNSFLTVIALASTMALMPNAYAKLFDGPVDRLPVLERAALRNGQVSLQGENGQYTGRVLVTASMDAVWQVLTDYDNFDEFLPKVSNSELLEEDGDRKVFEQTNKVKIFLFNKKSRVRIAVQENYPQQITFNIVDGDLETLDGAWKLEAVSPYPSAPPNQVLMTHQVNVEPGSIISKSIFFDIYEDTLKSTLAAIKEEVEQRDVNQEFRSSGVRSSGVRSQESGVRS